MQVQDLHKRNKRNEPFTEDLEEEYSITDVGCTISQ